MKRTLLAATTISAIPILLAQTTPPGSAGTPGPSAAFARFVDEYFDARFAARPTEATRAGLHQYDSKMPDLSRAAVERRIGQLHDQLRRLQSFESGKLSFDDAIDADVLEGRIRSELLDLETLRTWEVIPCSTPASRASPSTT